jgi:hypothetical protein
MRKFFKVTGIVLFNPNIVLNKLNIRLLTLTPFSSKKSTLIFFFLVIYILYSLLNILKVFLVKKLLK